MKAFRYRLYPTVAQAAALNLQLSEAARLYNAALQERRDAWSMARKNISCFDQIRQLKEIRTNGDLAIPSYRVAMEVLQRVDRAFDSFFRRVKAGETPGYPRFRAASRYDSLTFTAKKRWVVDGRVRLFGVGDVKLMLHRPIEGTIRTVTVKRHNGRWFVSFICDVPIVPLPATTRAIGIDVGLSSFAVLSDGVAVENPRCFERGHHVLRVAQRRLARRVRGSRGRQKAVALLQRVHELIDNQRRDFHHKTARALVNRFDLLAVEDLNVKGLARSRLARAVNDAGWGQFLRLLSEKAANAARVVVAVDPSGTSQRCSGCGDQVPKKLSVRWHECSRCGLFLGRDHNAARNILSAGMALVGGTWPDVRASVPTEATQDSRSTDAAQGETK